MADDIAMATKECLHIIKKGHSYLWRWNPQGMAHMWTFEVYFNSDKDITWEEDGLGERL